ncbi:hypothetical protein DPEC_G00287050 [Dallia pectoralis]|uniref:Uncharacterized protein n=1 Tax=Dallia pectoralis TaxID=75939 RepID=A0ACC2FKD0_DALPE|nr:hypothetical protein DPEC_G00287050 [Dallia pectoralis]
MIRRLALTSQRLLVITIQHASRQSPLPPERPCPVHCSHRKVKRIGFVRTLAARCLHTAGGHQLGCPSRLNVGKTCAKLSGLSQRRHRPCSRWAAPCNRWAGTVVCPLRSDEFERARMGDVSADEWSVFDLTSPQNC